MELYAKGQLSYLILTCMQERDFYGLDIISEISARSGGKINLKKPSVYSNLTRMEKQGYISSYLKSSDFGPNRKYYSLTEKGRNFYQELKTYFDRNNIDVFKDFAEVESNVVAESMFDASPAPIQETEAKEEAKQVLQESEEENFFDFSSLESDDAEDSSNAENEDEQLVAEAEETTQTEEYEEIVEESIEVSPAPVATDFSLKSALLNKTEEEPVLENEEKTQDDGVFISKENADEYNKRLYDISKDINRMKRKRSFAEDQISMTSATPLVEAQERSKINIEDFKNAILGNKNKYAGQRLNEEDFAKQMNYRHERAVQAEQKAKIEEIKNDAVYITDRIDANQVERAKKIEPPRLQIVSDGNREYKLPAPKRDTTIDPSHKEILTQLYSKTRDNVVEEEREDAIYDYNDLKDYYDNQNIDFSVYQKPAKKLKHNTNKLYMIVSLITFLLATTLSAVTYFVLMATNLLNPNTSFVYIVLPVLVLIDLIVKICHYKHSSGWMPKKILPQGAIWAIFLLIGGAIVGINFACGMNGLSFGVYATTLILPLVMTFVLTVVRYYIKRFALIKFWR